jgi:hypothetical protein
MDSSRFKREPSVALAAACSPSLMALLGLAFLVAFML